MNASQQFQLAIRFIEKGGLKERFPNQSFNYLDHALVAKLQSFYALYKQATVGPCTADKPSKWGYLNTFNYLRDSKKWEAWSALGDMGKDEAMRAYVSQLSADCVGWEDWEGLDDLKMELGLRFQGSHPEPEGEKLERFDEREKQPTTRDSTERAARVEQELQNEVGDELTQADSVMHAGREEEGVDDVASKARGGSETIRASEAVDVQAPHGAPEHGVNYRTPEIDRSGARSRPSVLNVSGARSCGRVEESQPGETTVLDTIDTMLIGPPPRSVMPESMFGYTVLLSHVLLLSLYVGGSTQKENPKFEIVSFTAALVTSGWVLWRVGQQGWRVADEMAATHHQTQAHSRDLLRVCKASQLRVAELERDLAATRTDLAHAHTVQRDIARAKLESFFQPRSLHSNPPSVLHTPGSQSTAGRDRVDSLATANSWRLFIDGRPMEPPRSSASSVRSAQR